MLASWIGIRHREHTRYMKTNNPLSAYALHILNNKHEYGNAEQTIELLKPCNKGKKMKCWESFYIQIFQHQNTLIEEQKVNDLNPPYTSTNVTRRHVMYYVIHHSTVLTASAHRDHQHRERPSYIIIKPLRYFFVN